MILISSLPKRFPASLSKKRRCINFKLSLSQCGNGYQQSRVVFSTRLEVDGNVTSEAISRVSYDLKPFRRPNVEKLQDLLTGPGPLTGTRTDVWWTGLAPGSTCPGYYNGRIYSLPQLEFQSGNCSKYTIQAYFDNTWTLTEVLLGSLQGDEAFTRPPYHDLRHPMLFYYGHPAALYVNKLRVAGLLKAPINPYFEVIFETGVDEMSWDDLSKNKMPWPTVAEVHSYRKTVYKAVSDLIQSLTDEQCAGINQKSPLWALVMAFEHERIHLETSSYLISELPKELVRFPAGFPPYHPSVPTAEREVLTPVAGVHYPHNEMIPVTQKTVSIGKPSNFPTFGWDNEYGYREYSVPAFQASKYKITNGEFLEFVKDGGYGRIELWTENGWSWRAFRNIKIPNLWVRKGPQGHHQYDLRLIFDVVPMPWDWPVVVNFHEAAAFAKWKSLKSGRQVRVITELEHKAIRDHDTLVTEEKSYPAIDHVVTSSGDEFMKKHGYNLNLSCSSMSPVTCLPPNKLGFHDVFGNAWEWTTDYFAALPGFEVHPYYEDFSTPCFDGLHHVIQGGSFISTGNEASVYSRFHFRPHFYQHASFRVVEQLDANSDMSTLYSDTDAPGPYVGKYPFRRSKNSILASSRVSRDEEKKRHVNNELSKHFGAMPLQRALGFQSQLPSLTDMVLKQVADMGLNTSAAKLLEVGCGPGGNTLAFAKHYPFVMGIDHDHELVEIAKSLRAGDRSDSVQYSLREEGQLDRVRVVDLQEHKEHKAGAVEFRCADPMCLPAELKGFDVVVLNDIIDKVSSPNSVLSRLGGARGLVKEKGGLLVVASCFQWDENVTPKSLWLGGYVDPKTGTPVQSEATLCERLADDFRLARSLQLPIFWQQDSSSNLTGKILSLLLWVRK